MDLVASFQEFLWSKSPQPTRYFVYHRGQLMVDRARYIMLDNTPFSMVNEPVNTLANMAWGAYQNGVALLAQKRLGRNMYEYRAYRKGDCI